MLINVNHIIRIKKVRSKYKATMVNDDNIDISEQCYKDLSENVNFVKVDKPTRKDEIDRLTEELEDIKDQ